MRVLLPPDCRTNLIAALASAGRREIGGVLMGEHVATNTYRVASLTIQSHGGTFATFVRLIEGILRPIADFFRKTNHRYTRFNYLGEWHSHHSFSLTPSTVDMQTMRELVDDPEVGPNFAVLLTVRLEEDGQLSGSVSVFLHGGSVEPGELVLEGVPA